MLLVEPVQKSFPLLQTTESESDDYISWFFFITIPKINCHDPDIDNWIFWGQNIWNIERKKLLDNFNRHFVSY